MSRPYYYDDGEPIEVELGAVGLSPEFVTAPAEDEQAAFHEAQIFYERELKNKREGRPMAKVAPLEYGGHVPKQTIEEMREILAFQYSSGPAAGNSHDVPKKPIAGTQSFSKLDDKAVIEIIHYGRSHRYEYSPKLWEILAPIWRTSLIREGREMVRSIQHQAEIIERWKEGVVGEPESRNTVERYAAYYTASVVEGIHWVRNWWNENQPATLEEFEELEKRTVNAWTNVTRSRDVSYPILHELGIEYMKIRRRLVQLEARLYADMEERIESGKKGQDAAELVESTAASLWDLYAQLRAGGNANRLALYRLGILGVRAGFRGGSDYVLAGSDGEKVLRNFAEFAIPEAATVLADWIMGHATGIKRLVKFKDDMTVRETLITELMKILLTLLFDTAIWHFYDSKYKKPPKTAEEFAEEQKKKIAIALVKMVITVIARRDTIRHPYKKMMIEKLVGAFEASLSSIVGEYDALKQTADKEKTDVVSVFLDDWKFYAMRFVGRFALALAQGLFVKSKVEDWHALERAAAKRKAREELKAKMGVKTTEIASEPVAPHEQKARRDRTMMESRLDETRVEMEIEFEEFNKGLKEFHQLVIEMESHLKKLDDEDHDRVMKESDEQIASDKQTLKEMDALLKETDAAFAHFEDTARQAAQQTQAGSAGRDDTAQLKKSPLMVGVPAERFPPEAVRKDAVDESDGNVTPQDVKKEDLDLMCQGPLRPRGFLEQQERGIHVRERLKRKAERKIAAIRAARAAARMA